MALTVRCDRSSGSVSQAVALASSDEMEVNLMHVHAGLQVVDLVKELVARGLTQQQACLFLDGSPPISLRVWCVPAAPSSAGQTGKHIAGFWPLGASLVPWLKASDPTVHMPSDLERASG